MATPDKILDIALRTVSKNSNTSFIADTEQLQRIEFICRYPSNRACARALLACLVAKIHQPEVDIRKPYTEIDDIDTYSGRHYDEQYVALFIATHELPCRRTTAFLTPAFRNRDEVLTRHTSMVGRPQQLYEHFLALLDDVAQQRIKPEALLNEIVRQLINLRDEQNTRLASLLGSLKLSDPSLLSVESIVNIIWNHLSQPYSSRLPVLAIFAIYKTIESKLNERIVPLQAHNAADSQTDSLGDVEIANAGIG